MVEKQRVDGSGADYLREFGYEQSLKRDFNLWSVFALAIAFISPIVALYAIFGLAFVTAGPAFWWGFLVVLAGQLLVALVFAELVSRWPLEGSVYQWSRQMLGGGYGWFAGWAYIWTLLIAMAAVSYGTATFLAPLLGIASPSNATLVLLALGTLAFTTIANTVARALLKTIIALSVVASVLASAVMGTILLLFYRENSISVVFSSFGAGGEGFYLTGPFLASVAIVGWAFVGFESAGAVAEEVQDPERNVPKAVIFSILIVALLVIYTGLALILAIPDLGATAAGEVEDPILDTLAAKLGPGVTTPLFAMIVVGFTASLLAIQTSVSRFLFSFGRDRAIPAARFFEQVSVRDRLPVNAIVATAVMAASFFLLLGTDIYATLVTFTTVGFYVAFAFPRRSLPRCPLAWSLAVREVLARAGRAGGERARRSLACVRDRQHILAPGKRTTLVRELGRDHNGGPSRPSRNGLLPCIAQSNRVLGR
ncbi:Amino acid transporter (plasmid) [Rubrobacter radiotolerans]|uniref:Amino acid permease n=1 Tax=Rubrobacter radiotolerans TaxID=42256 RepID=A0A023X7E1_RUBRA|nr:amino acid permease [Rubrobacter radiotolerans]AHY48106.1 Amino acid transporter [Rubrobacter radiotolerans]MDX5895380.1 amino acid permease [Rubrobacter radiotolerans]SMC01730.1 amino acid/polyamine/organocation transporter, APC superfamily [Rubrobacter radiotolerans DSM 5868]